MTTKRRSSRIAEKSHSELPVSPPKEEENNIPNQTPKKGKTTTTSETPKTVSAKKSTVNQESVSRNDESKSSSKKKEKVAVKKSSKRYLSKFLAPCLETLTSNATLSDNSSPQKFRLNTASTKKWLEKVNKHILRSVSTRSKVAFLSDDHNVTALESQVQEKQQAIEAKLKTLSQSLSQQIARSKFSTLPRLPAVAYESGQFEEKVGTIGDKINKISMELSNATKQLEERVVSFDQTYSIIKGNVDHLLVTQQQQAISSDNIHHHHNHQNKPPASGEIEEENKGGGGGSKDPLNKLQDHLFAR